VDGQAQRRADHLGFLVVDVGADSPSARGWGSTVTMKGKLTWEKAAR
jgi:hypothetical protein